MFNPFFEQCRHEDYRKEVGLEQGDCKHCENTDCKGVGEFMTCPLCDGDRTIIKSKESGSYFRIVK